MKRFITENKFVLAAIVFDILTIIAVILYLICDLSAWAALISGIIAITLNTLVKRRQKSFQRNTNE